VKAPEELYRSTRTNANRRKFWSWLTGDSRSLLDLGTVEAQCSIQSRCYAGIQTVPISQIQGSEGRSQDFDAEFRPLQSRTRDRWVGIATAGYMGRTLPPVELIQVGDLYFVRDGHHRISVARAMGQEGIEAEVTVWQVVGLLPWEKAGDQDLPLPLGSALVSPSGAH